MPKHEGGVGAGVVENVGVVSGSAVTVSFEDWGTGVGEATAGELVSEIGADVSDSGKLGRETGGEGAIDGAVGKLPYGEVGEL